MVLLTNLALTTLPKIYFEPSETKIVFKMLNKSSVTLTPPPQTQIAELFNVIMTYIYLPSNLAAVTVNLPYNLVDIYRHKT